MKLQPIGARLAVQFKKLEEKKGVLIIPNEAPPQFAEIVAMGPDVHTFKIGDLVTFGRYQCHEVTVDDVKYLIIEAKDVIAQIHLEPQKNEEIK